MGADPYSKTSGSSTQFDDSISYAFSGEFGFALLFSPKVQMRLGFEGFTLKNAEVTGNDETSGTALMDITSKTSSFMPTLSIEYAFLANDKFRAYVLGGLSYAKVTVSNDYTLTSTGTSTYSGALDQYKETWESEVLFPYHAMVGIEYYAFDNVTLSLEGGWRQFVADKFSYKESLTVIRGGSSLDVTEGSTVRNNSDEKISLDLSGPYAGIVIKFYIPPLN